MRTTLSICLFILLFSNCWAQEDESQVKIWRLNSIAGELKLRGLYQELQTKRTGILEFQHGTLYSAGLVLNTKSYIIDKKFLVFEADGEYNPETHKDYYLLSPNVAEVGTLKRLNLQTTFFEGKAVVVSLFTNFNQAYSNRENLSTIRTDGKSYGGNISWGNKFVPLNISYVKNQWNQTEMPTERTFFNRQSTLRTDLNKSFGKHDQHSLNYLHDDYFRQESGLLAANNKTDFVTLNDNFLLGTNQGTNLNSMLLYFNLQGNNESKRYQATENFSTKLPHNLSLLGNYNFNNTGALNDHMVDVSLRHQLFESLSSGVTYEYMHSGQKSVFTGVNHSVGFDVGYTKKIPTKGQMSMSYSYSRQYNKQISEDVTIPVTREPQVLVDGQIVLLKMQFINESSVVVKDETGVIIYRLNLDYILVPQSNLLEIRRIPGGTIANNTTVYVSYTAIQPGSFQYDGSNQNFSADVMLFNHLLEIYYRTSKQDYFNLKQAENLSLNYYSQNTYGTRIEYKFARGGVDFNEYKSTLIPYHSVRYFINLQGNYHQRLIGTLNGDMQEVDIVNENLKRRYINLSAMVAYSFKPEMKLNTEVGYQKQEGKEIDLDLFTGRTEFTFSHRKLYFTFGAEAYLRNYLHESFKFGGAYIQIVRRFNR